jgi:elongation factor G
LGLRGSKTGVIYRHKKQTGGHGQYGHVCLDLEPMPRGTGAQFTESIVGGSVPRNYIPAVEKGVYEALQEGGVLARFPVTDIKVNLYYGSYHTVDSSDMAFQIAGAMALRKAVKSSLTASILPLRSAPSVAPSPTTSGGRLSGATLAPQLGKNTVWQSWS